jgi:hypothetical protein
LPAGGSVSVGLTIHLPEGAGPSHRRIRGDFLAAERTLDHLERATLARSGANGDDVEVVV